MTITDVNTILAALVICAAGFALAGWISPQAMEVMGRRLLARAFALRAARECYAKNYREQLALRP